MSDFGKFAMRLDKIAKDAFADFQRAEKALAAAEAKASEHPQRGGFVDAEYAAKSARAAADLLQARAEMDVVARRLVERSGEIRSIRRALAEAVADSFAARPGDVDRDTISLLESGVDLTADELQRLLDGASNRTMRRVIVAHAQKEADSRVAQFGEGDPESMALRAVTFTDTDPGSKYLEAFDFLTDVFDRTCNNPCMIDDWSELTAETVENF